MNPESSKLFLMRNTFISLMLLSQLLGCATEQGQSLSDRRRAINDGSAAGIVLIPAWTKDETANSAAAPASASEKSPAVPPTPSSADVKGTVSNVPESKPTRSVLSGLPPPSGRSMNSAKELSAPDIGIPLPSSK